MRTGDPLLRSAPVCLVYEHTQ